MGQATQGKLCPDCKQFLPYSAFYTAGKSKRGVRRYSHLCKECFKADRRRRYAEGDPKATREWEHKAAHNKAVSRAKTRLARLCPELYDMLLAEEMEKEGAPYIRKFDYRHYQAVTIKDLNNGRSGNSPKK